jgi:glutamine synthetase type III
VFIGYHGEALDEMTPLLRSSDALSSKAIELLGAVPAVVLGGSAALAVAGLTAHLVPRLRTLGRIV